MACHKQSEKKHTLEERIYLFLETNPSELNALQIAKAIGLSATKDVNRTLYKMEKDGRLLRKPCQPPLWCIINSQGGTQMLSSPKPIDTTSVPEPLEDPLTEKISEMLLTDGKSIETTAAQLARKLSQPRKVVNQKLYSMQIRGQVEKTDDKPVWRRCEGNGTKSEQRDYKIKCLDVSIKLASISRFLKEFDEPDVLGSGGFGCVVKAKLKLDHKIYAIKIVQDTGYAHREVTALANLEHRNIVRYYTVWNENVHWIDNYAFNSTESSEPFESPEDSRGEATQSETNSTSYGNIKFGEFPSLFIQMELCEGGTLDQWIDDINNGKHMDDGAYLKIFHQILCGVEYIHSKGLIHRDLKPANIFLGRKNTIKIGDLGLVKDTTSPSGVSIDHTAKRGTQFYMSPEQMKKQYGNKTDIYSLGVILFLLRWKMQTKSEKHKVLEDLQAQTFPEDFIKLYSTEHNLLKKMLSHDPDLRPNIKEIRDFLRCFMQKNITVNHKTA